VIGQDLCLGISSSDSYDICPAGAKLLGMECESITSADLLGLLPSRLKIVNQKYASSWEVQQKPKRQL
jgi:hypothetical protein